MVVGQTGEATPAVVTEQAVTITKGRETVKATLVFPDESLALTADGSHHVVTAQLVENGSGIGAPQSIYVKKQAGFWRFIPEPKTHEHLARAREHFDLPNQDSKFQDRFWANGPFVYMATFPMTPLQNQSTLLYSDKTSPTSSDFKTTGLQGSYRSRGAAVAGQSVNFGAGLGWALGGGGYYLALEYRAYRLAKYQGFVNFDADLLGLVVGREMAFSFISWPHLLYGLSIYLPIRSKFFIDGTFNQPPSSTTSLGSSSNSAFFAQVELNIGLRFRLRNIFIDATYAPAMVIAPPTLARAEITSTTAKITLTEQKDGSKSDTFAFSQTFRLAAGVGF